MPPKRPLPQHAVAPTEAQPLVAALQGEFALLGVVVKLVGIEEVPDLPDLWRGRGPTR